MRYYDLDTDGRVRGSYARVQQGMALQLLPEPDGFRFPIWDGTQWVEDVDAIADWKRTELEAAYNRAMASGFDSDALGATHRYESDLSSQIKLAGAALVENSIKYRCAREGIVLLREHTASQMRQVLRDGAAQAVVYAERLEARLAELDSAQTTDEIESIKW